MTRFTVLPHIYIVESRLWNAIGCASLLQQTTFSRMAGKKRLAARAGNDHDIMWVRINVH